MQHIIIVVPNKHTQWIPHHSYLTPPPGIAKPHTSERASCVCVLLHQQNLYYRQNKAHNVLMQREILLVYQHMHFKYNSYSHYILGYHIVKFAAAGKQSNKIATGQRPVVYTRISKAACVHKD